MHPFTKLTCHLFAHLKNLYSFLFFLRRQIVVKDREKGEAELRAKKGLNCEKKKNYKFDIVAVSCAGISSEK